MPTHDWHGGDESTLAELKEALSSSRPVPERMRTAARAAFSWRGVDDELELLVLAHDSALDADADVRDAVPTGPRTLMFEGDELCVEIEVGSDVIGQLVPPQQGRVTLVTAHGFRAQAEADGMGCFRLPRPERGPVRLTCRTDRAASTTEWTPL